MKTKISRLVGQLTIPFLILSMLAVMSIGIVQASPSISIDPAAKTGLDKGDSFSVDVKVDPAGNSVNGVEINLKFDQTVVQLISVDIKNFLGTSPNEIFNDVDNTSGTLHLLHTVKLGNAAVSATGTYVTLNFMVKTNAPNGTSALDLTSAKLSNAQGKIPGVVVNDGTITVGGSQATSPSISIDPATKTGLVKGDSFSVDVKVDPAGNSVNGVEINLKFDQTVVQLISVDIKNFLGASPNEIFNDVDNTNGTLHLLHTVKLGNSAVSTSGTYATLNFKVKTNAPTGTYALDLTTAKLANAAGKIPGVVAKDGAFTVSASGNGGGDSNTGLEWAFISVPFRLENSTVAYVLSGIQYDALFGFDPVNKIYVGGVTNFEPLKGYLIHMNTSQEITNLVRKSGQPQVPPSLHIENGWNLVGTSAADPKDAETMLGAIDPGYYSIWNFNVSTQSYDKIGINGKSGTVDAIHIGTDVFIMQPKVSYWVWATQETSLPAFSS